MKILGDVLFFAGFAALVIGIALINIPAACITGGIILMWLGLPKSPIGLRDKRGKRGDKT